MKPYSILLVDDEEIIFRSVGRNLAREGYQVSTASSGEEALQKLKTFKYDLVITDVVMEGMDGIEVLKRTRELDPDILVMIHTGQGTMGTAIEALRLGACDFLLKPCTREDLIERVRKSLTKLEMKRQVTEASSNLQLAISQLKTGVCHEILSPLSAISDNTRLLLKNQPQDPPFQDTLGQIQKEIRRIELILGSLLRTSNQKPRSPRKLRINEELESTLTVVEPVYALDNIKILRHYSSGLPDLFFDADEFSQITYNLLHNAQQAMPEGGTLTVSTARVIRNNQDYVRLRFLDTGKGIPARNLDKIFHPYFSTKKPTEGAGMGLFTCQTLLQKYGGTIEIKSRENEGAEVLIDLPVTRETPS
ncbi:MAG: hypothetical protein COV67_15520 [Nitrospinae bacterium CG11_big_fil_rev_8_21_14_0_20_56_8]|nr:MAG: hypothetical protein COV67_15520 [Nitrospinae bacterium CG11_big_fil_rev_8_21_14_0_20_56_8]